MTELGRRLRQLRRAQEQTLREVAQKAGYSEAYLSQVETHGRASPSLASLKKIAAGYGVSIVELFADDDGSNGSQIVLRRRERARLPVTNPHVSKELLVARQSGKKMEPLSVTIAPGGGSKGAYDHAGEEFGLVLSGHARAPSGERRVPLAQRGQLLLQLDAAARVPESQSAGGDGRALGDHSPLVLGPTPSVLTGAPAAPIMSTLKKLKLHRRGSGSSWGRTISSPSRPPR